MFLILTVILLILLAIYHYATDDRKYWLKRRIPYKEPCPIFGNFGATIITRRSYSEMMQILYDAFPGSKYVGMFQARRPTLMVKDVDAVKFIMSTEFPSFCDRIASTTDTTREPLLRNLSNMSGSEWKAMRQVVTPTFSTGKMKAMFPLVAECAENLKSLLLNISLEEVNVPKVTTRYTTDVIGSCAFGVNPSTLKNPETPFLRISQLAFSTDRSVQIKRYIRVFFPKLFKILNLKSYSQQVETFFTSLMKQVLSERRKNKTQRMDFLQLMLNEQKTESGFFMTDELITSNSYIFMLAGLETTSTTLSFCLYELAKQIEIQEKVRKEVLQCLNANKGLTYEAVTEMRYTSQVILETLRMHPPVPLTTRMCTSPCKLPDIELTIQPKDKILIPIICIQRDPKNFPNPDKFDPDRFAEAKSQVFLTFGMGPRSCPGKPLTISLAYLDIPIVIVR